MTIKKIFIFIFFSSLLHADILFTESFNTPDVLPDGWTYDQYFDPVTGAIVQMPSGKDNWRISPTNSTWQETDDGYTPPAAEFWYEPRIPTDYGPNQPSAFDTWYELSLYSPEIDVGDDNAVIVEFDISLNYWNTATTHKNGMAIETNGGDGWSEMLKYEVGGQGAGTNFDSNISLIEVMY